MRNHKKSNTPFGLDFIDIRVKQFCIFERQDDNYVMNAKTVIQRNPTRTDRFTVILSIQVVQSSADVDLKLLDTIVIAEFTARDLDVFWQEAGIRLQIKQIASGMLFSTVRGIVLERSVNMTQEAYLLGVCVPGDLFEPDEEEIAWMKAQAEKAAQTV